MTKPNLLLVSATEMESGAIQSVIEDVKITQHVGKTIIVGNLYDWRCTLLHTGIGSVNAAHALTCQLERATTLTWSSNLESAVPMCRPVYQFDLSFWRQRRFTAMSA